jgi:hypothetical protein
MYTPKPGDIAVSEEGLLGLITSDAPDAKGLWHGVQMQYRSFMLKGFRIQTIRPGDEWISEKPEIMDIEFQAQYTGSLK